MTVEQDSDKDLLNCVFAAANTVRGTRYYVPEFGIDDLTFQDAPLDEAVIAAQLANSEPRADPQIVQQIVDGLVVRLTVGVDSVSS